ncbi:MAG: MBOAT family protein [Victivallales bacterium]
MVFSSYLFLFYFLPVALASYFALFRSSNRIRNLSLIIAGYIFYGWANPKFIFLMLGTTLVDWLVSVIIAHNDWRVWRVWHKPVEPLIKDGTRTRLQKWAIVASVVSNLLSLGFFKYFNFGIDSYNSLFMAMGWSSAQWDTAFRVILPLGISFYTFQSLSYTIDVYRGDAKAMKNLIDFSCFVSMYPHLVAGPILQFSFLADQLENRKLMLDRFARGVAIFSLGLGKKILLANGCGKIADTVFNAGSVHALDAWYGAVAYSFQIYFDFSGYSDMAIGLGLMLGFIFAKNFDSPYISLSITEFWRRWHISLSSWLRDYLYVPLGGSRKGPIRTYINLFLVMLLGGLWHGASWNFVIWGGIHGSWLALERRLGNQSLYSKMPAIIRMAITFGIVCLGWVFFRAADLPAAILYLQNMLGVGYVQGGAELVSGLIYKPYYLLTFAVAAFAVWWMPQSWDITRKLTWPRTAWCVGVMIVSMVVLFTQTYNPFIYFIF